MAYELMNMIIVCCLCQMLPMMMMDSVVSPRCSGSVTLQPTCIGREPMDRSEVVGEVGHLWAFSDLSVDAQNSTL